MAKFIDEFRDSDTAKKMVNIINGYKGKPVNIMEVCGTHTMSVSRYGIRSILPPNIRLISGPGCPVCVTPTAFINTAIELSRFDNVIITTFGDIMRIPGSNSSLLQEKAEGRDIMIVYSPLDCIQISIDNPDKKVVFLSVGFETTTPAVALAITQAAEKGIKNFSVLSANKTMPEALKMLAADPDTKVDAFLYPGHVTAITGTKIYEQLAEKYNIPGVVSGFEPLDILYAVILCLRMLEKGEANIQNVYSRVVRNEGNPEALAKLYDVFEPCDAYWRGIGMIPGSGLKIKSNYSSYDAWKVFDLKPVDVKDPHGCICGHILKGTKIPSQCGLFGKACTPENPVGACMVSSEGTCAAYYKYENSTNNI